MAKRKREVTEEQKIEVLEELKTILSDLKAVNKRKKDLEEARDGCIAWLTMHDVDSAGNLQFKTKITARSVIDNTLLIPAIGINMFKKIATVSQAELKRNFGDSFDCSGFLKPEGESKSYSVVEI